MRKNPNRGRTYDSAIEFRHYFLEFPNIGRDLYQGIYGNSFSNKVVANEGVGFPDTFGDFRHMVIYLGPILS